MSRAWKQPNKLLPGWDYERWRGHHQTVVFKPKISWKSKRKYHRKPSPKTIRPDCERLLYVEAPHFCAGAVFTRNHGHWRCTHAAPILDWMTRIIHLHIIEDFFRKHHYRYTWIKSTPVATATSMATEIIPADRQHDSVPQGSLNTDDSLNVTSAGKPCDDQTAIRMSLEQNGVATSSLLNCSSCDENSIMRMKPAPKAVDVSKLPGRRKSQHQSSGPIGEAPAQPKPVEEPPKNQDAP